MAQFMHLEYLDPDRDISLYINCPGGSFSAMTAVYDTMQYVNCDVETICLGQAASAAAVLLAGGTPGKRFALPGARVVIHQPSLPEPVQGQATDLAIQAEELMRIRGRLEEMLVRHTGQSAQRIAADIERDTIFDAPAAVEYGLVDRIIPSRKASRTAPGAR
jgi:ATP-dependent Clp protease protease subunit